MAPAENIAGEGQTPAELWLGYDLIVPFEQIGAVLAYQPAWDRRIVQTYGHLPNGIQAIVMLSDGQLLPSRRSLADLHARWVAWQSLPSRNEASDRPEDDRP